MRRTPIAAVSLLALGALLAGCSSGDTAASGGSDVSSAGGESASGGQLTIGLAVANQQADFFNQIRGAAQAEAKSQGIKLIVADPKGDADVQVSQIQDFITQGVDAIIYIPAGATAASVPVRAAKDAGIPIVTVDRNPADAPGDTFIATDSVAAAKVLGEHVIELTGGEAKMGIVQGQVGTTPEEARDEGFKEAMAQAPGMEEVARQASLIWAQDEGYDIATDMLQAHPEITLFFGRADALALGAAQAARTANRDDVVVVGFDGDVAGLEAVRDGVLDATICQQTQLMGRLAVQSAVKLVNGETLPAEQLQEGVLTTKDNVEPFIKDHP